MAGDGRAPDPLRDYFIRGARNLLDRAYDNPGIWVGTRLLNPTAAQARIAMNRYGVDVYGPDNVSAIGGRRGGLNARSRWARAFVRCLYDQHKWWAGSHSGGNAWRADKRMTELESRGLEVEIGRALPGRGVIGAGRAVRIRMRTGGQAKRRAVGRLGERDRIWIGDRQIGQRFSDPALRDWE